MSHIIVYCMFKSRTSKSGFVLVHPLPFWSLSINLNQNRFFASGNRLNWEEIPLALRLSYYQHRFVISLISPGTRFKETLTWTCNNISEILSMTTVCLCGLILNFQGCHMTLTTFKLHAATSKSTLRCRLMHKVPGVDLLSLLSHQQECLDTLRQQISGTGGVMVVGSSLKSNGWKEELPRQIRCCGNLNA